VPILSPGFDSAHDLQVTHKEHGERDDARHGSSVRNTFDGRMELALSRG